MKSKINRESGFYWVEITTRWVVAEYDNSHWYYQGGTYNDKDFKNIDENRITSIKNVCNRITISK